MAIVLLLGVSVVLMLAHGPFSNAHIATANAPTATISDNSEKRFALTAILLDVAACFSDAVEAVADILADWAASASASDAMRCMSR